MTSFPRLSILRYAGALMGEDGTPLWRGPLIEAERGNTLLCLGLDDRVLMNASSFCVMLPLSYDSRASYNLKLNIVYYPYYTLSLLLYILFHSHGRKRHVEVA